MFGNILPIELENLIYKNYFSNNVIPDLMNTIITAKNKKYFSQFVLTKMVLYSIMEQATRLINSVVHIPTEQSSKIDSMYYELIHIHTLGLLDIFV